VFPAQSNLLCIDAAIFDALLDLSALDLHLVDLPLHLVDVVLLRGKVDGSATTAAKGLDGGEEDICTGDRTVSSGDECNPRASEHASARFSSSFSSARLQQRSRAATGRQRGRGGEEERGSDLQRD
jgi:hypothetical protein